MRNVFCVDSRGFRWARRGFPPKHGSQVLRGSAQVELSQSNPIWWLRI